MNDLTLNQYGVQDLKKSNLIVLSVTYSLFKMMVYVIKFQPKAILIRLMKTNYDHLQPH